MLQLSPLFVERNTPKSVPAKRFVSLTASDHIAVFTGPEFTVLQFVPLLVEI